jgi:hypothetical protein
MVDGKRQAKSLNRWWHNWFPAATAVPAPSTAPTSPSPAAAPAASTAAKEIPLPQAVPLPYRA